MHRRATAPLALLVLLLSACSAGSTGSDGTDATAASTPAGQAGTPAGPVPARSVILVSGDGMGAPQREAGRLDQEGVGGRLTMDALPVTGEQTTAPDDPDSKVTDSAAAATAWATGQKTRNRAISVDADGHPLLPLGAEAGAAGKATGLVTTSEVTDATPAAFFSSVADRDEKVDIARQYLEDSRPSVVLGGGAEVWSADLVDRAQELGYEHVSDAEGLAAADGDRLLGLFADEQMYDEDAADHGISLATMTSTALEVLSRDEDGFFLLVEEEAVDSMGHDNDGAGVLGAMRSLDDAVQVARDHVATHPDTLLIVTGDHETGGLTVEDAGLPPAGTDRESSSGEDGPFRVAGSERSFVLRWSTESHTGAPIPVSAEGWGSEQLAGSYPNTHVHEVVREALLG